MLLKFKNADTYRVFELLKYKVVNFSFNTFFMSLFYHMTSFTSTNSGMLHTGFDAPLDSIEMDCIKDCQSHIFPVLDQFHIPYKKCGTILVAWNDEEVMRPC